MFENNTDFKNSYQLPVVEVQKVLETSPQGLSMSEAGNRLSVFGSNALQKPKSTSLLKKFFANFTHLMAILLWIGGAVAFIARMPQLGIAVWAVNLINGAFSFWQEFRAEKATEALKRMLPVFSQVYRDGVLQHIPAEQLVPGDLIQLAEGDRISADCRLVQQSNLRVDESALTGESRPVRKIVEPILDEHLTRAEIRNLVFAGTSVTQGTGQALVVATGMKTEFGKIADLTQNVPDELSPLQKEMEQVTRVVTLIAVLVGVVIFILAVSLTQITTAESFIFALGMIVAFVPEGLLPTVTLALAMGTQRMAKRGALIKKLSAVETLGCTTVICTDKTGTLTQNAMTVRNIWLPGKIHLEVTGNGYTPRGEIRSEKRYNPDDLNLLVNGMALCNNARLLPPDEKEAQWSILGDPTEAALLVAAGKAGVENEILQKQWTRLAELPFDGKRKSMTSINQDCDGNQIAYVKGAPKEILERCQSIRINGYDWPLTAEESETVMSANDAYAREGLRVLAIAYRPVNEPSTDWNVETIEQKLVFLGLAAMMDPPRPEVAEAIRKCHKAGIRIVMITGDYGLTAESIARRIGIFTTRSPRIITGAELDQMDDFQLYEILTGEVLFARVSSENKLRIVDMLKQMGQVVAVTGDGVNDAPALKKADIGIAMGLSGSDVAKEAADMILTDDNFASIVNAIEEGRGVYSNIKKFTTYIFTSNTPEAWPFILFAFSGGRIPLALTVMQVLCIDLGTDIVPALGLGAEPPEMDVMNHPPRKMSEHVITGKLLARAYLWLGTLQSIAAMAAFYYVYWTNGFAGHWIDLPGEGWIYKAATTMALAAVVATQVGNLFAQRSDHGSSLKIPLFNNRLIWIGVASELAILTAIVYLPPLQEWFGTCAFPARDWLFLLALCPLLFLADELRKGIAAGRHQRAAKPDIRLVKPTKY